MPAFVVYPTNPADPLTPADGAQDITGDLNVSGDLIADDMRIRTQDGEFRILDAAGTTTLISINDNGSNVSFAVTGDISSTGAASFGTAIVHDGSGGVPALPADTSLLVEGAVLIDGSADVVQLTVQGNATQTALPFVVENSAGTNQFTVSNAGVVVAAGTIQGTDIISTSRFEAASPIFRDTDSTSGVWTFQGSGGLTGAVLRQGSVPSLDIHNASGTQYFSLNYGNGITGAAGILTAAGQNISIGNFARVTDGASAVAHIEDTDDGAGGPLATAGAKLKSFRNDGVEKAYIDKDGDIVSDSGIFQKADGTAILTLTSAGSSVTGANGFTADNLIAKNTAFTGVTAVKTADYAAVFTDSLVLVDVSVTGNVIVTLPAANTIKGNMITVKATATHATRTITIQRAGADTIEGVTAGDTALILSPTATLDYVHLQSDGTSKWYLVGQSGTIT